MEFIATFTSTEGKPVRIEPFYFGSIHLNQIMSFYKDKITNVRNINAFIQAFSCELSISYSPHEATNIPAFNDSSLINVNVPTGMLNKFVNLRLYRDLDEFDDLKEVPFFNYFMDEMPLKRLWKFSGYDAILDADVILEFLGRKDGP